MGIRRSFRPTNLVTNGNFINGDNWTPSGGTESVANNIYTFTGNGGNTYPYSAQTVASIVVGRKYYLSCKARVTNAVATTIALQYYSTPRIAVNYPVINQWYKITGVITATETGNRVLFQHTYADAATANGKVMEVQQVLAIDLTALFGAGNEPTQAWCDLNIPNWFDGTLSGGKRIGGIR